ncbi:TetR/AcrR family transcriptional regulator [Actinoplanes sp. Pm04-4]|uniref:TetR/AcrR family transcriptional regulator n=1 Tax=Paractinoplanes pyxinae TaxID=2997416 RepID=A0ABT4AQU5_9ACTN|nr:TetR/AcrR family transcriptional regulator [Actinoplanes pyxinae]MCY1136611.1 TetR/AcrR family transcriptional regulator [Actinoplanes pyxinae]
MARTVNERDHAARRDAILTAAYRLIATKGYQQMTVQDLLDDLAISKGAFYHYFDSKPALLDAFIDRVIRKYESQLAPVAGSDEPPLERLRQAFVVLAGARVCDRAFMAALRVLHSDDNAVVMQRSRAAGIARFGPLLAPILREGAATGVFRVERPEAVAAALVTIVQDLVDATGRLLLDDADWPAVDAMVSVYTEIVERTLGVTSGSIEMLDRRLLEQWVEEHRGQQ